QTNSATPVASGAANHFLDFEGVVSGTGLNTLVGANLANTWKILGPNSGVLNNTFSFSGFGNLVGGTGSDRFVFPSLGVAPAVSGMTRGGGGIDTLDYSAVQIGVTVNLTTGSATGVGQGAAARVFDIANVIGGWGDDNLTGGSLGGVLIGGGGN